MKDRRFVDDLSTAELERILFIKRRQARLARLRQMSHSDRVVGRDPLESPAPPLVPPPISAAHRQFQGMGASASYHSVELEDERRHPLKPRLLGWLAAPLGINWRFVFNGVLLFIETMAVIGLLVIVVGTRENEARITEDVEAIEEQFVPPTPTAEPLLRAVVLPGGHTPPDIRGFSQPEPVPEHLEKLLAKTTPQPVPKPGLEHATRIVIPAIGVDHAVVLGDDWEALKRGVGHTSWSAHPGEVGNCVLTAHNDIYGEIFRRLPELELGDDVFLHTKTQIVRYEVKAKRVVEPTQVEVMEQTSRPMLTLISSYPYLVDDKRIVVIGELQEP